jgi:anthranilate phosphoribosyltransferase
MHSAVLALLNGHAVPREAWRSYWDDLEFGVVGGGQSVALLASLATSLPRHETLVNFIESLNERRPLGPPPIPGSVNVVGTGGGPSTFNVSTAASVLAAAMGVPVIKSGSRAYASACGSLDMLGHLGIRLTGSTEETLDLVAEFGIAFAGTYVYPVELVALARHIVPLGLKPFGRFLNALGPFLAAVPVAAQVTGVSDAALLGPLRQVTAAAVHRAVWLVENDLGVDELLGFTTNRIHPPADRPSDDIPLEIIPGIHTSGAGDLAEVAAVARGQRISHFVEVLAGRGTPAATEAVALNAAVLATASGQWASWSSATAAAYGALHDGAAIDLVQRLRKHGIRPRTSAGASHG